MLPMRDLFGGADFLGGAGLQDDSRSIMDFLMQNLDRVVPASRAAPSMERSNCHCNACGTKDGRQYKLQQLLQNNNALTEAIQSVFKEVDTQAKASALALEQKGIEAVKAKLQKFHDKKVGDARGYSAASDQVKDLLAKVANLISNLMEFDNKPSSNLEEWRALDLEVTSVVSAIQVFRNAAPEMSREEDSDIIVQQRESKAFNSTIEQATKHFEVAIGLLGCLSNVQRKVMNASRVTARSAAEAAERESAEASSVSASGTASTARSSVSTAPDVSSPRLPVAEEKS